MRALVVTCIVALGLAVSPSMAKAAMPGDNDNRPTGESSSSSGTAADPGKPTAAEAKATPAKAETSSAELETELQEVRELLEAQTKQLQAQQEKMQLLEEELRDAKYSSEAAAAEAADPSSSSSLAAFGPTVAVSNGDSSGRASGDEPASISFKGITLTPGGFMAAETVWRERGVAGDVNTPFNSIPFAGANAFDLTEFNASGRQSRISMLVQGQLSNVKIGGYYETDFLGTGITSNYNQSNSFVLRQRQFWAQAAFENGITITGGQMWSLVTETKHGLDNRTEANPMTIDAAYNVGFSWLRQFGFRVTKDFGNKVWLGVAVENAETTVTAHGQNANFLVGSFGATGGVLNPAANFAYTKAPDFVFKAAFEPGWGHYEIFGVVSTFRDRVFPCYAATAALPCGGFTAPSGVGGFNDTRVGGGVGANARATFFKKVDLGIHFLGGDGVGRYGAAQLADVTVRPDGTLAPVHSFQGLGTIELHPTSRLDVYMYAGGEYAARTQFINPTTDLFTVGYGAIDNPNWGCNLPAVPGSATSLPTSLGGSAGFVPGSPSSSMCTGDTRTIFEGTFGFWYRFYKGSKGTVQWGPQYSYLQRNTWSGTATGTFGGATVTSNGAPHTNDNMVLTSFRYYLP